MSKARRQMSRSCLIFGNCLPEKRQLLDICVLFDTNFIQFWEELRCYSFQIGLMLINRPWLCLWKSRLSTMESLNSNKHSRVFWLVEYVSKQYILFFCHAWRLNILAYQLKYKTITHHFTVQHHFLFGECPFTHKLM